MDVFGLVAAERVRLADVLETLHDDEWTAASLCEGWSNHVVAAHLNLPWSVSSPAFLLGLAKARGNVDRTMNRFSLDLAGSLPPAECVSGLRAHATHQFTPPRLGPEAPLTDVVVHGADILSPLGRSADPDPEALRVILGFLTGRKARSAFGARPTDGVRIEVTDLDIEVGAGEAAVTGPALAVCGVLLRRDAYLPELTGAGLPALVAR